MDLPPQAETRFLVYELRTSLQDICPPIWRRLQIPSTFRLCCLHDALQIVMGWTDSHLHQFEKDDKPEKQTARKMIALVRDANAKIGAARVSCYTCHRGQQRPVQ